MGKIEQARGERSLVVLAATDLAARTYPGHPGEPLVYGPAAYDIDESWRLLSKTMRDWAEQRAGQAVRDPHTGESTIYWYCRVVPKLTDGPEAAARPASYDLVMFGKRGLVVSTGTTHHLDARGGPRWRHRRFDVEIDQRGVRYQHHGAAAPNLVLPGSSGDGRRDRDGADIATGAAAALLPMHVVGAFGNLPLATQQFLMEAFVRQGRRPVEANVHATTRVFGSDYRESLWAYLFDARHMGFAYAHRSVPWRSGLTGPSLWTGSPEAEALRVAPWTVVAWTAPRRPRDRPTSAERSIRSEGRRWGDQGSSQPDDGTRGEATPRRRAGDRAP